MKKPIWISLIVGVFLYLLYALLYHYHLIKKNVKDFSEPSTVLQGIGKRDIIGTHGDTNFITFTDSSRVAKKFYSSNGEIDSQWITKAIGISDTFAYNTCFSRISFRKEVSFDECYFDSIGCNRDVIPDVSWTNTEFLNGVSIINNDSYCRLNFNGCSFGQKSEFQNNRFHNESAEILFENCKVNGNLHFGYNIDDPSLLEYDTLNNLLLYSSTLTGKLEFNHCFVNKQKVIKFYQTQIPDTIILNDLKTEHSIELTTTNNQIIPLRKRKWWTNNVATNFLLMPIFDNTYLKRCKISIVGTDISSINLEYKYFELFFPTNPPVDQKNSIYQTLLEKFKKEGKSESYELLDKDYHDSQGGISNFISKYWWYYGYDKWLIFIWSLIFILMFSHANYKLFPKIFDVYQITSIKELYENRKKINRKPKINELVNFFISILYTSIVLFGIKLDVSKFNFNRLKLSLFILLQFLIGLICTGFVVNLILH